MNGALLLARTRRWPLCLALIATTGAFVIACGPLSYTLNPTGGYRVAAASQVPLLAALTIQGALASALPRQEHLAARPLWPWRLLHILLLTTLAAIAVAVGALFLQPPEDVLVNALNPLGPAALARDLLAFTGAALICSALAGPRLGWILPLAWAILPAVVAASPGSDPTGLLTLAIQPDNAPLPLTAAVTTWVLGTILATSGLIRRRSHC